MVIDPHMLTYTHISPYYPTLAAAGTHLIVMTFFNDIVSKIILELHLHVLYCWMLLRKYFN
jgi:hypothetical protein